MQNSDIIKQLKTLYYTAIVVLTLYFILIFFRIIELGDGNLTLSDWFQTWTITLTIAAIPLALWIFSEKLKKTMRSSKEISAEDVQAKTAFVIGIQNTYRVFFLIRLVLLSVAALLNITLFGLTRNVERLEGVDTIWFGISNFFWFSVIVMFVLLVFCKPSEAELEKYTTVADVETRRASSLQTTENDDDDNIMWWEKGKQKTVPIDSVISETVEDNDETA